MDFSNAAKKGDNFVGQVDRYVVIDGDQEDRRLEVVVKLPPANSEHRKALRVGDFFRAEAYAYAKLLPTLTEYYKKNSGAQGVTFPCFPR